MDALKLTYTPARAAGLNWSMTNHRRASARWLHNGIDQVIGQRSRTAEPRVIMSARDEDLDGKLRPAPVRGQYPISLEVHGDGHDERIRQLQPSSVRRSKLRGSGRRLSGDRLDVGCHVGQEFVHGSPGRWPAARGP